MKFQAIKVNDIPHRKTIYNKFKGTAFLANGVNNDYPTVIELLTNSSTTAKTCAGVVADYIFCKGFSLEINAREQSKIQNQRFKKETLYINDKRETPNDILKKVARDLSVHRGVFLHVNYNAFFQKTSVAVLPYKYCRLGAKDSKEYKSKVLVYNNWDKQNTKEAQKNATVIDVYDPRPEVLSAQIQKAGGIENYKGQVFFLNLDANDSYPLSFIDGVMLDCQSERLSSEFINAGFKRGFFGKYVAITAPIESEKERDEFREQLKSGTGADSLDTVFHFEANVHSDDLSKSFLLQKIESNINDKVFEYSDKKTANNIRKAYGNIPPVLIDFVEGKLGNTSGESLKEAQLFMQGQMEQERQNVQEMFEEIFDNFYKPISENGIFEISK